MPPDAKSLAQTIENIPKEENIDFTQKHERERS